MSKKLIMLLAVAMFSAVLYTGCAKPPTELQNQAQQALDAAKADGADMYAKDSYDKAAGLISEGNGLVDSKDYKGAAEKYQAAIDAANGAKGAVPAAKEAIKKDVLASIDAIMMQMDDGKKSLDAAKKLKKEDRAKMQASWTETRAKVDALKAEAATDPVKAKGDAAAMAGTVKGWLDQLALLTQPPAKPDKIVKVGKTPTGKAPAEKKSPVGDKKPAGKK